MTHKHPQTPTRRWLLAFALIAVLALLISSASCSAVAQATPPMSAACNGDAIAAPGLQRTVFEGAIDISPSNSRAQLRTQYLITAETLVEEAESRKASLRIVTFGASGVGARTVVQVTFADSSQDELFNLAAANKARCAARRALRTALAASRRWNGGGTDVAGTLAALIADGKARTAPGGLLTVTVLTDGCQAPATSGPNRRLTDLCGALAGGTSAQRILQRHAAEFAIGRAAGATVVMKGIGVGGNPNAANSLQARKLVMFWQLVCHRAQAARCVIESSVL